MGPSLLELNYPTTATTGNASIHSKITVHQGQDHRQSSIKIKTIQASSHQHLRSRSRLFYVDPKIKNIPQGQDHLTIQASKIALNTKTPSNK
jgi:hypothetical protein